MGVIFTILVPIMFPVAGKAVSDTGMAVSPAQSKRAAMIVEQFVQLQLKIIKIIKKCYISSGITWSAIVPTIAI